MDIVLESKLLTVKFKQKGAEICSIKGKKTNTEYIWQADPAFWGKHAPILFPFVGRLKEDTYIHQGKKYQLPQHGFAREMDFDVIDRSVQHINFALGSSEITKENYPFDFLLIVSYRLKENRITIVYEVENQGKEEMLYSIGAHPGFRVPLHENEQRSDYEVLFEREETAPAWEIRGGLLTGSSNPVLQNQKSITIADNLFENDALVFKGLKSEKISLAKKGRTPFINLYFFSPFFGIWSKSSQSPFVCLEPWRGIADSISHNQQLSDKEGIRKLAPGSKESFQVTIEVVE